MKEEISKEQAIQLGFVIPVFDRPSEINTLLQSLVRQSRREFEVVIVEDGSTVDCREVVSDFESALDLKYIVNPKSLGPGLARNVGVAQASGNFFVFIDSDCFLPAHYVETVISTLSDQLPDAFGGPDTGHPNSNILQKAINYSMTSFLTTGGIRGGRERLDLFYPKGFNMGVKKQVFESLGGFKDMRYGEDTEFSYRIRKSGYTVKFITEAFVFHKRRNDIVGFSKQVFNSGKARVFIQRMHPEALKPIHILPATAVLVLIMLLLLSIWELLFSVPILIYGFAVLIHASIITNNPFAGVVSICTSFVQVVAYGVGYLIQVLKPNPET